jgi:glutamyl-tRNA reductase
LRAKTGFHKKTPKTYLNIKGQKLAFGTAEIQQTVEDTWNSSQSVMQDNKIILEAGGLTAVDPTTKPIDIINVRITHKTAHVPLLEAVSFKDKANAYTELRSLDSAVESVIIQTCNRIELYLVSEQGDRTVKSAVEYLENRASAHTKDARKAIEYSVNHDALNHLLRVTSGLESMVIGEDQVINQVWNAYLEAEKAKATGPVLNLLFNRAVNVGNRVRRETGIGKGAVSVGSAAVELAENLLGSLNERKF